MCPLARVLPDATRCLVPICIPLQPIFVEFVVRLAKSKDVVGWECVVERSIFNTLSNHDSGRMFGSFLVFRAGYAGL